MSDILALWPVYAPGAFFAALAVGMIRLEEFRKARAFFWAAAVLLGFLDLAWQSTTPAPFWLRAPNAILTATLVFVVFPRMLKWVNSREKQIISGRQ